VLFLAVDRPGGLPRLAVPVLRLVFVYLRELLTSAFARPDLVVSVISLAL
jgi:hypothetical protein